MTGTVRCRGGRAARLVDVDPNEEFERGNQLTLKVIIDRADPDSIVAINAMIEMRARHGWAIHDWMAMRHHDGRTMTVDEQEEILRGVRRRQAGIVTEHRAECPDCETCRQIDRGQGRL